MNIKNGVNQPFFLLFVRVSKGVIIKMGCMFRYKLKDIDCDCCLDKGNRGCKSYDLCPYIMDNLSDLLLDFDFREAVRNAVNCKTPHRKTLIHLKQQAEELNYDFSENDNNKFYNHFSQYEYTPFRNNYKPECKECRYGAVGFVCCNEKTLSCLRDFVRKIENARS